MVQPLAPLSLGSGAAPEGLITGLIAVVFGVGIGVGARALADYGEKMDSLGSTTDWNTVEAQEWKVWFYRALGFGLVVAGIALMVLSLL